MNINEYLVHPMSNRLLMQGSRFPKAQRVRCADGFSISVQANEAAYCTPRSNLGPYTDVECGYPSADPGPAMLEHADDRGDPMNTIYAYVPVEIVDALLESHGGIVQPRQLMSASDKLRANILAELEVQANSGDPEEAHLLADMALCHLLNEIGYGDVVDAWEKIKKWYA